MESKVVLVWTSTRNVWQVQMNGFFRWKNLFVFVETEEEKVNIFIGKEESK